MSNLLFVLRIAKARGLNVQAIWKYLIEHKADILAAIAFLLELLGESGGNFAAGPEPTGDECIAELVACGCSEADAHEIVAAC